MRRVFMVNNLNYQYFHNIWLSFEKGKFYKIIGPNKSGKTTLFRIMSGLIKTNNYINCDGITLNNKTRYDFIKKIGVVERVKNDSFQHSIVYDEMVYPLHNLNYLKRDIDKRINNIVNLFQMKDILNKKITDLNPFKKQLLLLMIALLHEPKVLLVDNVFEKISSEEQSKVFTTLRKLVSDGLCVIYFSHTLENILESDEIILINDYKVIKKMKANDVINNDKLFYDNNIEIPFMLDLNIKLKMYNVIQKKYDSMEKMVDDIWQ